MVSQAGVPPDIKKNIFEVPPLKKGWETLR